MAVKDTLPSQASDTFSESDQRKVLEKMAHGKEWQELEQSIEERLESFPSDAPIKKSTRRAMVLIKSMTFEHL